MEFTCTLPLSKSDDIHKAAAGSFPDAIKRYGLSQVHVPSGAGLVDIVFVHGLYGHPYDTWTSETSKVFWPGQLLPLAVHEEQARVLVYGYSADGACLIDGVSKNLIHIHAEQLVAELCANRRTQNATERPLIFVAHSFGGLVANRALIYSSEMHSSKTDHLRSIFISTYGILFLGTPHGGTGVAEWDTRLESIYKASLPAGSVVSQPRLDSAFRVTVETIQNIDRSFVQLANRFRIFYFHEGKPTTLKGSLQYIVTEESAAPSIQDVERACIQQDHSHMCKFENDNAPGFQIVSEAISRYASQAVQIIISRWNTDKNEQRRRRVAQAEELLPKISRQIDDDPPGNLMSLKLGSSKVFQPLFLVPFSRDDTFINRTEVFKDIEKQMKPKRRVALSGIGGIGKSQIAIEYCYRFREDNPHAHIFWVHASSKQRFDQAYRDIASRLELPGRNDPNIDTLHLVCDWFNGDDDDSWLVVLDNADDLEMFYPGSASTTTESESTLQFLPQTSRGFMIITSRDERLAKRLAGTQASFTVNPMSAAEAQELLESRQNRSLSSLDRDHSSKLFEDLEYLPLAIAQAAAFIDENHIDVSEYLKMLSTSDSELQDLLSEDIGDLRRDSRSQNSIIKTWKVSFDLISKRNPCAAEILSLMAVLDRQGTPESLIKNASDRTIDFRKALGTLLAFSLIKSENSGTNYGLHRLVQLATQKWLEIQNTMGKWQEKALIVVADIFPYGTFDNWTVCESLLPHAQKVLQYEHAGETNPKEYSVLLQNVAKLDYGQGRYQRACSKYLAVIAVKKELFGADHPDTLHCMADLGVTYRKLGRLEESEKLLVRVLEDMKRVLGAQHGTTLGCMNRLAATYRDQGRWDEAEAIQVKTLEARKRLYDTEHSINLSIMNNLTNTYRSQGRWKEAEELQVKVLDAIKRVLGAEHPGTLVAMNNLALTYGNKGQFEEAEALFTQVLEIDNRRLGAEHPETLVNMNNLAGLYRRQGRWTEAETLCLQVLDSRRRVLGSEHPQTLLSMHDLAVTYFNQGRWKEAETLYLQVLNSMKRVLGSEHLDTLTTMANLAILWDKLDRRSEAIKMMERVLESRSKALGAEHKLTINAAAWLEEWSSA